MLTRLPFVGQLLRVWTPLVLFAAIAFGKALARVWVRAAMVAKDAVEALLYDGGGE